MVDSSYFQSINETLKQSGLARPCILIDLDRVDQNLESIVKSVGSDRYRLVTKSLPSPDLIRYVLRKTRSNKLMAFHLPFLHWMLRDLPDAGFLMGKPFLKKAVYEFLIAAEDIQQACSRIEWLVDTPARLEEHRALANELAVTLRINIEIDVGLHRGGVNDVEELDKLLSSIKEDEHLRFMGFMGYEAHVPHYPDPDAAFEKSMSKYRQLVNHVSENYPHFNPTTLNSGGSSTFDRFASENLVNDISAGSAVVKPAAFSALQNQQPALFIATPVIRKFPKVSRNPVPKSEAMSLYLYGGGWAAEVAHPNDVSVSPFADPPNQNLLPNQSLYETRLDTPLEIGDFVFFWPYQSDAIFQFEEIQVLRGGNIVDKWSPLPVRF